MHIQNTQFNKSPVPLVNPLGNPKDQIHTNETETMDRGDQASTVLQSHIRRKNVEERILWPRELRNAWSQRYALSRTKNAFFGHYYYNKEKELSTFISHKLLKVLEDPNNYGKDLYFPKVQKGLLQYHETSPFHTFYMTVSNDGTSAIIAINDDKKVAGSLGYGKTKVVTKGLEIKVPLSMNKEFEVSRTAISRLRDTTECFDLNMALPNQFQQDLYDKFKNENLPGRIACASRVRQHIKNGSLRQELVGPQYLGNLSKLYVNGVYGAYDTEEQRYLKFEDQLSLAIDIFETLDSLHEIDVIHQDINIKNILVGEENGVLHGYLHDFYQPTEYHPIGRSSSYYCWDLAKQIGLLSPSSDIVGAMIASSDILLHCPRDIERLECHGEFKMQKSAVFYAFLRKPARSCIESEWKGLPYEERTLSSLKKIALDNGSSYRKRAIEFLIKTHAKAKILELFYNIFSKEEDWKMQLQGSCICYIADLTADEYKKLRTDNLELLRDKYKKGSQHWLHYGKLKLVTDEILNLLQITLEQYKSYATLPLLDNLQRLEKYSTLPAKKRAEIELFRYQLNTLSKLLHQREEYIPLEGDPALFSLLCSDDPQKRKEGREIGYRCFGRAADIKQEIQKIREEYLGEMKNGPSEGLEAYLNI